MASTTKTRKRSTGGRRSRGTIAKRGTGKWLVRVYRGRDEVTGKRIYQSKTVTGSRKDAQKALTKLLRDVDTNPHVKPNKHTLGGYLQQWLAGKTGVTPRTLRGYRERLEGDVIPYLGHVRLTKLRGLDVQALFKELVHGPEAGKKPRFVKDGRKLAPRTVQYAHVVLKQALEDAVEHGLIARNPVKRIKTPKVRRKGVTKASVLTPEQAGQVMRWAEEKDPKYEALWTVLLTTGMRPGEALALKWDDLVVDEETGAGLLYIQRVLREGKTREDYVVAEASAKTAGSLKPVSIPVQTVEALKRHKVRQAKLILKRRNFERLGFIFTNGHGKPLYMGLVRRRWKRACKLAGVPVVRLYDTRHTHATALLVAGVNPKVVQERLRHSSVTLTLNTYSHVLPETERQTAAIVEGAFFPDAKTKKKTG